MAINEKWGEEGLAAVLRKQFARQGNMLLDESRIGRECCDRKKIGANDATGSL